MTARRIEADREAWQRKPVLRAIYADLYAQIAAECRPGRTLEIGGGSGNLKARLADVVSTDIQFATWLDAVADAHRLPFQDASFDNIVLFDVLHHLAEPKAFLDEAVRVLRLGGRVVMVEPHITPVSGVVYRLLHVEPVRMSEDPFALRRSDKPRDPYEANQAIPTLLFERHIDRLRDACPRLSLVTLRPLSLFAYPLSGGFQRWSLIPESLVRPILALEERLLPRLGALMSFRMLATLERV